MADTVDRALIAHYAAAIAAGTQYQGLSVMEHYAAIGALIAHTGARTLLDYGCGAAAPYREGGLHHQWGVPRPALYDPAVPAFAAKPGGRFDGVICCDVLEHIPLPMVDAVLAELFGYARKFLFLVICCRSAKKWLPDGRNVHLTVMAPSWWEARIAALRAAAEAGCAVEVIYT